MVKWLFLSSYHALALIVLICVCSVIFAWNSFGLINLAMANVGFLSTHGALAIMEGGLVQLVLIGLKGLVSLISYLGFKAIETELIARWRGAEK